MPRCGAGRVAFFSCLFVLFCGHSSRAAEPQALAKRIDALVAERWSKENVRPAPTADDAEFLRRVTLDLAGRIPSATEVRTFLADADPAKRAKLIDRLATTPESAAHFARFWRERWLPQSSSQFEELKPEFEAWLRQRLRDNVPYDRMVRELLRVPEDEAALRSTPADRRTLWVFLQANEFKPANLAGSTARMFLGLNLDCAQCHDHPFARWTRQQFWDYAAFFADPTRAGRKLGLTIPNDKGTAMPKHLDGTEPQWQGEPDAAAGRAALADWIAARQNPYFARNAVNQMWAYLFGTGLVEPLDDLSDSNPPSHRELLDELESAFADSGYDLRFLLRTLARTRAYQLSSADPAAGDATPPDPRLFARAEVRAMTGDQLYDSLTLATGVEPTPPARKEFLYRFGRADRPTQAGRSILQALTLANGPLVAEASDPATGRTLTAVADAPFLDTPGRVEALFLATLSRPPRPDELRRLVPAVESGGRRVLGDVMWALLNGYEFAVVH